MDVKNLKWWEDPKPEPKLETIPGTDIIYRKPRDIWAESGVFLAGEVIYETGKGQTGKGK